MADAKQGKSPMEDFYNGATQSRVVLAKPRLGGFGGSSFASSSSKSCNPFGSVLRPSTLKPGSNPFLKVTEKEEEVTVDKDKKEEETEERLKENESKEEDEAPKFVPLGSANVTPRTSNPVPAPAQPTASSSSSGFVFGQNLSERVVMQEAVNNGDATAVDHSATNGTTELLFTSAAASVMENNQEEAQTSEGGGSAGLAAAAAEYERSHARPPPPTTNYNLTGEEGEANVLQISCRLFAWEGGSWRERGRGVLRLNETEDAGRAGARLVVRVAGSLRVVLNTQLWPDMVVERAGTKSLRITAADAQHQIKLYLIMGAPADIVQLYRALSSRVALSKRSSSSAPSQQAAERLEAQQHDDFSDPADTPADAPVTLVVTPATPSDTPATPDVTPATHDVTPATHDITPATPEVTPATHDVTPATHTHSQPNKTEDQPNPLKRKEPADKETSPKRQCPDVE